MKKAWIFLFVFFTCIFANAQDMNVFDKQTGNPVIPAYLADASIIYDQNTKMFYAYGTNDGAGGGNVYPTQMWYSKDCKS